MTAHLLNFPSRRPLPKATIQASVVSSTVINTPDGPLFGNDLDRTVGGRAAQGTPEAGRGAASGPALDCQPRWRCPDPATEADPKIEPRGVRRRRCGLERVGG